MDQLSFSFPEVFSGFAQADGMAAITPAGLRLQFETRDAVLGIFKTGIREVVLPWSDLAAVTLKNEFLGGAVLRLRASNLTIIEAVPGRERDEIVLKVDRARRKDAAAFAERLQLRVADQNVAQVLSRLRQITE